MTSFASFESNGGTIREGQQESLQEYLDDTNKRIVQLEAKNLKVAACDDDKELN